MLVVTADHSTPCVVKDHPAIRCPSSSGAIGAASTIMEFNERAVTRGGIGRIRGTDVMPMITQLMGVQEKLGA